VQLEVNERLRMMQFEDLSKFGDNIFLTTTSFTDFRASPALNNARDKYAL